MWTHRGEREVGKLDVGCGVEVAHDVVACARQSLGLEEGGAVISAPAAVLGVFVKVKGVVAGLGEATVAEELGPEDGIELL